MLIEYQPQTDFSEDEADLVSGRSTVRTANLDAEHDAIAASVTSLISGLTAIWREDNQLLDGVVKIHTLASEVLALFAALNPAKIRGTWGTGVAYLLGDVVGRPTGTYVALAAHTSGVFATDLAAGLWTPLWDSTTLSAAGISFTPAGTIAAANVQAAIVEAASEAMQKASNLSDVASLVTARGNLSVFSKAEIQAAAGIYAVNTFTSEALRGSYTPAITALVNGMTLIIEATGPNTGVNVTFCPNFGVVPNSTITKRGGYSLEPGEIYGAGHRLLLSYRSSIDTWELMNPAYQARSIPGIDIIAAPGGQLTIGDYGSVFSLTTAGLTISSIKTTSTSGAPLALGTRFVLRCSAGAIFLNDAAALVLRHGVSASLLPGETIEFMLFAGGVWQELSRRDLPSRERVAIKLALSQLAR